MRNLTDEERDKLDVLHLQVRRETDFSRQVALVDQIAKIIGYPEVDPKGKWARQLVAFICAGTDDESTYQGSLEKRAADRSSRGPE